MAVVTPGLTLVVLGATGFVGSALLRLVERNRDVPARCLVRSAAHRPVAGHVRLLPGSFEDLPADLFPPSPYVIYHLATRQHHPGRLGYVAENLRNAERLAQRVRGDCRGLIYTSSLSVLGRSRQVAIDESAPVAPGTELAAARAEVERCLLGLGERLGASVFCVRTRFVLGRGDTRTLPGLHRFMGSGLIPATGRQRFSVIDVDDLAEVLLQLGRRCQERSEAGAPVRTAVHAGYRQPISLTAIRQELRSEVGGIPGVAFPVPPCLRHLGALPVASLRTAARQLELFGLPHWTRVDRLESEIGTAVTRKDPRVAVREAARWLAQERRARSQRPGQP